MLMRVRGLDCGLTTKAAYLNERVKQLQESTKTGETPASYPLTMHNPEATRGWYKKIPMYILATLGWVAIVYILGNVFRPLAKQLQPTRVVYYFVLSPFAAFLALVGITGVLGACHLCGVSHGQMSR